MNGFGFRSGLLVLVQLLMMASVCGAADEKGFYHLFLDPRLVKPIAPDLPFRGAVRAHLPDVPYPAAFHPLANGHVLVLDSQNRKRLREVAGETTIREIPLAAADLDPVDAALVDLLPRPDGSVLVLDSTAGCMWLVRPDGRIAGHHGLLVAATSLAQGMDGRIYVDDPGSRSVVAFDQDLEPKAARRGLGLSPHATGRGELPFLSVDPLHQGALLGLVPSDGRTPTPTALARLSPPAGMKVMDVRVIGITDQEVFVRMLAGRADDENPRDTSVLAVRWKDPSPARVRRLPVPTLPNYCMDCGPTWRVAPDGTLWAWVQSQDGYRVIEFSKEGVSP